ncbi:MAG: hypothetical protein DCO96_13270 [Fluviicola sp. XM-24bin1]|jgi:hypothetical protein|nr:MAG: hypothetical protein DCO96_13270 [Fluviicola sp. XM-24bin1]
MIIDSTYMDGDTKRQVDKLVGKAFGLRKRLSGEPIGSHRMLVDSYSEGFEKIMKKATGLVYCNVELRPIGAILHLNVKHTRYSWVIPFRKMTIYDSKIFSFHADGQYLKFHKDEMWQLNKKFMKKLMDRRVEYHERFKMP